MPPTCPLCLRDDKTYPVRGLYLQIIARRHHQTHLSQDELTQVIIDICPTDRTQAQCLDLLQDAFTPPAGAPRGMLSIHPDAMVAFFALLALALILQMAFHPAASTRQPVVLLTVLVMISLLAYGLAHARILTRYRALLHQDQAERGRVEQAITRWMALSFCSRDQVVFTPGQPAAAPFQKTPVLCNEPDYP